MLFFYRQLYLAPYVSNHTQPTLHVYDGSNIYELLGRLIFINGYFKGIHTNAKQQSNSKC